MYKFVNCHVHTHAHTHIHTTHVVCVCVCVMCVCVYVCICMMCGCVCACVWVCLCMHVFVCLMCVCLAFRVMLNGMTKVATPLLASSSSLGRPIGAPRVFLTRNTCFWNTWMAGIQAKARNPWNRANPSLPDSNHGSRRLCVSSWNTTGSSMLPLACPESACQQA